MYLLDTNIVSLLDHRRSQHDHRLATWIRLNGASLYLSVLTIAELEAGSAKLYREKKRERARQIEQLVSNIITFFGDRLLDVDLATARHIARLNEHTHMQLVGLADIIIAATAARHGLSVVTRNVREFQRLGADIFDPLE